METALKNESMFCCSFCLGKIATTKEFRCGKCTKRIYCSKKCQSSDWKKKGNEDQEGQGHSTWCGVVDYGEEFVDWRIIPVPGKGEGIVALRDLPHGYRIMVDGFGIADILDNTRGRDNKLFHSTKLNHSCNPNAGRFMDPEFKVAIVYAVKDIKAGDEVSINYYSEMSDVTNVRNLFYGQANLPLGRILLRDLDSDRKRILYLEHSIICDFRCFCFKPEVVTAVRKANEVNSILDKMGDDDDYDFDEYVQKLINMLKVMGADPMFQAFIMERGGHYCGNIKNKGKEWMEEAYGIYRAVLHPKSLIIHRVKCKLLEM